MTNPNTLVAALRLLARDIYCEDGIATACIADAANAIEQMASEIEKLRLAIRRLAEQDAMLSVQGGNVIVTMGATLTDAEREAIAIVESWLPPGMAEIRATLCGLLERLGGGVNPAIQPYDATPMAGSGPTVPANDRASDCSEDGRVRASASSIGNTHEPVAWGVVDDRGLQLAIHPTPGHASHMARNFSVGIAEIVPLYRHKQQTLTDAEREAVEAAIKSLLDDPYDGAPISPHAATLRGLLERLK